MAIRDCITTHKPSLLADFDARVSAGVNEYQAAREVILADAEVLNGEVNQIKTALNIPAKPLQVPDVVQPDVTIKQTTAPFSGDTIRDLLKINLSKLSGGGVQSNILGIPIAAWNAAVETVALLIDGGLSVQKAIRKGFEEIRKVNSDVEELAIIGVLNRLTEGLKDKPVREKNEKYGAYSMRVLQWRREMLSMPVFSAGANVQQQSQPELTFIKNVNAGIDILKGDMKMTNEEFNKKLGLPQGDRMTYIGALKYLQGSNKEATATLNELRKASPTVIAMSELALLKKQYRDWERGYKAGDKESTDRINAIKKEIHDLLSDYNEQGLFSGVKYTPSELLRMASYVNGAVNENTLNDFTTMVTGLIEKADYGRKVAAAKDLQKQVKGVTKKKTKDEKKILTANMVPVVKDLAKLNALRVSDIDAYNEMLTDVVESQYTKERPIPAYTRETIVDFIAKEKVYDIQQTGKEVMDKFYDVITDDDTINMVKAGKIKNIPGEQQLQNIVNGIISNTARSHKESIAELGALREQLNKFSKQVKEAAATVKNSGGALTFNDVAPVDYNESPVTIDDDREDNRKVLEDMARAQQNAIDTSLPYSDEQKKTLELLKGIDITGFDANKLRLFMNVLNNVVQNEDFAGAGVFETESKAQQNLNKLFKFLADTGRKIVEKRKAKKVVREQLRKGRESLSSTEQEILEIASNDPHTAAAIIESVEFDKIKAGWTKTINQLKEKLTRKLQDILDIGAIDVKDARSQMRLGMYSWLTQYKTTATELERKVEFGKRLNEIKTDIAIKEASKEETNVAEARLLKDVLNGMATGIKAKTGIDIMTGDTSSLDGSMISPDGILTDGEKQAYDIIREFHDEFRPQFIDIMERVMNKEFIGYENYMVDKTRRLLGGLADVNINDSQFFRETNKEVAEDESGSFAGRIEGNRIKQPISGEDTRVIDYDFFNNTISNARDTLYDINTIEDRMIADRVVSSSQMRDGVGHVKAEMLKKNLAKEIAASIGHNKNATEGLKLWSDVTNQLTRLAAKKNLYSFMAFPKQLFSAMANTMAFMGIDAPYVAKAAYLAFENSDVRAILDSREISMRGATKGGTSVGADDVTSDKTGLAGTDIGKQMLKLDKFLSGHKEFTGDERKLMGFFLEAGDVYGAKATWVALYAKYLKNNGFVKNLSDIDWAKERANINRDAAIYADITTSAQLNTNSKNAMGTALLNNDSASNIIRGMYALFGMFGINKSINSYLKLKALAQKGTDGNIISAIGKLFTGGISKESGQAQKDYAVKGLVAGFFEDIAFAGVKFWMGKLTLMAIGQALMGALGDDEGEKVLKEAFEKAKEDGKPTREVVSNAIGNYLFSFAGNQSQESIQAGVNWIYQQFGGEENLFYEPSENPNYKRNKGLLSSSGIADAWNDIYTLGRILIDKTDNDGNPIEQPSADVAKLEKVYGAVQLIHDLMQFAGIGDADFERIIERRASRLDSEIGKRYGDDFWINVADISVEELKIAGAKRELTDAQSKYYMQQRKARMSQLKDAKITEAQKIRMAVEYAKTMLVREYTLKELKIAKPEEKK